MTPEELKAQLLVMVEKAIESALADSPALRRLSLSDIERLALESREGVGAVVVKKLGQTSSLEVPVEERPVCPYCGGAVQRRGERPGRVVTQAGETVIERAYYYCRVCQLGFFPLG